MSHTNSSTFYDSEYSRVVENVIGKSQHWIVVEWDEYERTRNSGHESIHEVDYRSPNSNDASDDVDESNEDTNDDDKDDTSQNMYYKLAKKVCNLPLNKYPRDRENEKQITSNFKNVTTDKNPNGIKSVIKEEERDHFMSTYMFECPWEWRISKPSPNDKVGLLEFKKFVVYEQPFKFGFRFPFTSFRIRVTKYFHVKTAQLLSNS